MKRTTFFFLTVALSVFLSLALAVTLTTAAPAAQTTIDSGVQLAKAPSITFVTGQAITTTYAGTAFDLSAYDDAELIYTIDQTNVNTVTLVLQSSMDKTNWVTAATLVSGNAADATAVVTPTILAKWTRVYATVGNTNLVTITAAAVVEQYQ